MDEENVFCCEICLPALIAQSDQPRTVRALSAWGPEGRKYCRCGNSAPFELSKL